MKGTIFTWLIVFLSPVTFGQVHKGGPVLSDKEPFITELNISKNNRIAVQRFGHIIIKDVRADKSKMGYVQMDKKSKPKRIEFPKEPGQYLRKKMNNAILPSGLNDTIYILLKNIWLNETRTEATTMHKMFFGMEKLVSSCHIQADLFLKKNTHYLLLDKIDSVIYKKGEWLPNNCDKLLESAAKTLIKAADTILSQSQEFLSFDQQYIDSITNAPVSFAILRQDKPARGIYFTYEQFLTNQPRPIEFEIISDISGNINYPGKVREDTVWGYSDGENMYMHIANGYYQLTRAENTFEVIGPAVVEYMNTLFLKTMGVAASYFLPPKGLVTADLLPYFEPNKYTVHYFKIFRLGMSNGILY